MDIDLLFTQGGDAGLICSENTVQKALGIVLDTGSGLLSIEYMDGDYLEMNIPVEGAYYETLDYCSLMHIGAVKNGNIAQAYQVPLMFADDPYRNQTMQPMAPANPLAAFGLFLKACVFGQPVHRSDLGDDDNLGCILGDASPASLQFAPHLARRHALEARPTIAPSHGPGLGLGSSGGSSGGGQVRRSNIDKKDD